ncbi:hypothetical protein VNN41_10010 [Lactococcus garvieae]|uniref:hypothetical protein n=1 Tax=Lactococcus garvieae TaxID=1363 RepID=UPI00324FE797
MDTITLKNKVLILVFGLCLGIGATLGGFALNNEFSKKEESKNEIKQEAYQSQMDNAKSTISDLKEQLALKEKALKDNGPNSYKDLQATANKFFDIYYEYDQEKVTNKERRLKAEGLALNSVSESMFPLSADKMKSDYGYVQSKLNNLEVYPTGLNGDDITALVDASYSVKAGNMNSTVQHYMWKVTFDSESNRISKVEDMGKLTLTKDK